MTKIIEGQFSPTPSRPHTGLLGILIKHREQLEPGNKITGNAASQLLALSRAIIEGLGGKRVGDDANAQWEVEIGSTSTVNLVSDELTDMAEKMSGYLDRVQSRISALEEAGVARLAGVETMSAIEARLNKTDELVNSFLARRADLMAGGMAMPALKALQQQNAKLQSTADVLVLRLADAEATIERLAADMSRLEALLRSASNVEPTPAVEFQPVKRPGRRTLADLPSIGIPPKVATEK